MGFDEVQMMIVGHFWHEVLICEKPPRGLHFERWFWEQGNAGEAWRLWAEDAGPKTGRRANLVFQATCGMAFDHMGDRADM